MLVKQISVFLENKSGRLAEVTRTLAVNNINISALLIADTTNFGILRLIVNDPETAEKILSDNGFTMSSTNVISVSVPDHPGGLAEVLGILDTESIGIEYLYAFVGRSEKEALVILRVENPEKAIAVLTEKGIKVLSADEVYKL